MRKTTLAMVTMAFALQGCAGAVVYGESKKVSREVLTPVVAAEMPAMDAKAATDCVIKGMTVVEVLSLPNSRSGNEPEALQGLVRDVMARPKVGECMAAAPKAAAPQAAAPQAAG